MATPTPPGTVRAPVVVGGLVPGADLEGSIDRSVLLDRPLKIRTPTADSPRPPGHRRADCNGRCNQDHPRARHANRVAIGHPLQPA